MASERTTWWMRWSAEGGATPPAGNGGRRDEGEPTLPSGLVADLRRLEEERAADALARLASVDATACERELLATAERVLASRRGGAGAGGGVGGAGWRSWAGGLAMAAAVGLAAWVGWLAVRPGAGGGVGGGSGGVGPLAVNTPERGSGGAGGTGGPGTPDASGEGGARRMEQMQQMRAVVGVGGLADASVTVLDAFALARRARDGDAGVTAAEIDAAMMRAVALGEADRARPRAEQFTGGAG
jgi:hypothetical protein